MDVRANCGSLCFCNACQYDWLHIVLFSARGEQWCSSYWRLKLTRNHTPTRCPVTLTHRKKAVYSRILTEFRKVTMDHGLASRRRYEVLFLGLEHCQGGWMLEEMHYLSHKYKVKDARFSTCYGQHIMLVQPYAGVVRKGSIYQRYVHVPVVHCIPEAAA